MIAVGEAVDFVIASGIAQDVKGAVVNTMTAEDKSITVGGTATAPTVEVAISSDAGNALTLATDGIKVIIPAADYGAKMTDSSAITLELGILCHTKNPSDFKLVEANTYLYDGWIINATKYHAVYTNTSGAVKTSTNTYYSPNISAGNYFLLSLVCEDGGSVSMYVNGTLISEHTCTDFASYAGAIEKGVKVNDASAYYTNQHFRVYNKALTADEVKHNYNYFKVLHG